MTDGAASALTLGVAACMTRANRAAIHAIPTDLTGLKNEVMVQKTHRYEYDHAIRNCGARSSKSRRWRSTRRRSTSAP